MQFIHRFYSLLLCLFPRRYRDEYGDELQAVFNLSVDEALERGTFEAAGVILRELSGLPQAIIHEHLRERRRMEMNKTFASRFDFAPGSRTESFVALAPFLFGMTMILFGYLGSYLTVPLWMQVAFVILFWSAVLGLFLLGSAKGLPRWFLPYLGGALLFVAILLFNILVEMRVDVWWHRLSGFLSGFNFGGFLWMGLILLVFLLLVISRLVPRFHPFRGLDRVRHLQETDDQVAIAAHELPDVLLVIGSCHRLQDFDIPPEPGPGFLQAVEDHFVERVVVQAAGVRDLTCPFLVGGREGGGGGDGCRWGAGRSVEVQVLLAFVAGEFAGHARAG
jgi:hypothetical protein